MRFSLFLCVTFACLIFAGPVPVPGPGKSGIKDNTTKAPQPLAKNTSPNDKSGSSSPPPQDEVLEATDSEILVDGVHYGSYAAMSPVNRFLNYDPKYKSYLVYFKFGDGSPKRYTAYSTHNPSYFFTHRKDKDKGMGKKMEKATLRVQEEAHNGSGAIQVMRTPINDLPGPRSPAAGRTEWYEIYLGPDLHQARNCKTYLFKHMDAYGRDAKDSQSKPSKTEHDTYNTFTFEQYVKAFNGVLNDCAKRGPVDPTYQAHAGTEDFADDTHGVILKGTTKQSLRMWNQMMTSSPKKIKLQASEKLKS